MLDNNDPQLAARRTLAARIAMLISIALLLQTAAATLPGVAGGVIAASGGSALNDIGGDFERMMEEQPLDTWDVDNSAGECMRRRSKVVAFGCFFRCLSIKGAGCRV